MQRKVTQVLYYFKAQWPVPLAVTVSELFDPAPTAGRTVV